MTGWVVLRLREPYTYSIPMVSSGGACTWAWMWALMPTTVHCSYVPTVSVFRNSSSVLTSDYCGPSMSAYVEIVAPR